MTISLRTDINKAGALVPQTTGVTLTAISDGAADDFIFILGGHSDNNGTWNAVSGFTEDVDIQVSVGDDRSIGLQYKKHSGSEGSSYALTGTDTATNNSVSGIICAFDGVDLTTPLDAATTNVNRSNAVSPTPPAITTVTDGAWVVTALVYSDGTITAFTPPSGYTLIDEQITGTGVNDGSNIALAYKEVATAGLESPGAWGTTGTDGSEDSTLITFALRPAVAGGTINTVTLTDTIELSDSVTTLRLRQRILDVLIDLTDSVIEQKTGTTVRMLTDTIDAADGLLALRLRERYLDADSIDLNDQGDVVRLRNRLGTDLIELSDSVEALQRFRNRTLSDTIDLSDELLALRIRWRVLTDNLELTDSVIESYVPGGVTIVTRVLSDTIDLGDEVLAQRFRNRLLGDNITLADGSIISRIRNRQFSDDLTITDAIDRSAIRVKTIGDAIDLTDDTLVYRIRSRSLQDDASLVGSIIAERIRQRTLDDSLDPIDSVIETYVPDTGAIIAGAILDGIETLHILHDIDQTGASTNFIALEDGSGIILLEGGAGAILLEEASRSESSIETGIETLSIDVDVIQETG
jgi:hypothetical protein